MITGRDGVGVGVGVVDGDGDGVASGVVEEPEPLWSVGVSVAVEPPAVSPVSLEPPV